MEGHTQSESYGCTLWRQVFPWRLLESEVSDSAMLILHYCLEKSKKVFSNSFETAKFPVICSTLYIYLRYVVHDENKTI